MSLLSAIRPDEWGLSLFVHVLGAFALVGALVLAASYLFAARRDGSLEMLRTGYRALLLGAFPAFLVNRIGAQWILSEEGLEDSEDAWITLGFLSTDVGVLFLLAATIIAGLAVRRATRADGATAAGGGVALAAWLVTALVVIYAVVIWTMATKPA